MPAIGLAGCLVAPRENSGIRIDRGPPPKYLSMARDDDVAQTR